MITSEQLHREIVEPCTKCGGTGFVEDTPCMCKRIADNLVNMLLSGFPEEYVVKLQEETLFDNFTILSGKAEFKTALNGMDKVMRRGLSIVFMGDKSSIPATFLVWDYLHKNPNLSVMYAEASAPIPSITSDLLVVDCLYSTLNHAVESVVLHRQRKLLPTFVCLTDLSVLQSWSNLADLVGLKDGKVCGEVYHGVIVESKALKSRWAEK